jgi:alkanesulfonate monooxygenase SsuD/methylene tetrahydromethanopterin reductase-like flavin-dependent oxidoreductase (luciferase family)
MPSRRRLSSLNRSGFWHGDCGLSKPVIEDIDSYWSSKERGKVNELLAKSIIGNADDVRAGIETLQRETGADELMIVSYI